MKVVIVNQQLNHAIA